MNNIDIDNLLKNCKTGDLLLYSSTEWYSKFIEYMTGSNYSHISMILRDPIYINPKLKGLYILESSKETICDSNTGEYVFGVQIIPLQHVINYYKNDSNGSLYYRKLNNNRPEQFYQSLTKCINAIEGDKYDMNVVDLMKIPSGMTWGDVHKDNTFVCSAMVAYVYAQLGFLDKDIPWTTLSPRRFSYYENERLSYHNCSLEPEKKILFNNK